MIGDVFTITENAPTRNVKALVGAFKCDCKTSPINRLQLYLAAAEARVPGEAEEHLVLAQAAVVGGGHQALAVHLAPHRACNKAVIGDGISYLIDRCIVQMCQLGRARCR